MCEKCVGLDVRGTENMGLLLSDHRAGVKVKGNSKIRLQTHTASSDSRRQHATSHNTDRVCALKIYAGGLKESQFRYMRVITT